MENQGFFTDFIGRRKSEKLLNIDITVEWQVKLEAQYDEVTFNSELTRIKNTCEGSPIFGKSEHFETEAYATVAGNDACLEYALVYSEENKIVYICLQSPDAFFVTSENGYRAFSDNYYPKDSWKIINDFNFEAYSS